MVIIKLARQDNSRFSVRITSIDFVQDVMDYFRLNKCIVLSFLVVDTPELAWDNSLP